jgi:hypothetical protein
MVDKLYIAFAIERLLSKVIFIYILGNILIILKYEVLRIGDMSFVIPTAAMAWDIAVYYTIWVKSLTFFPNTTN